MTEKIIIVNAHWSNRGDEAALKVIIDQIRRLKPEAEIKIIFKDNMKIQQFPYSERSNISYSNHKFLPDRLDYALQILSGGIGGQNPVMKEYIKEIKKASYIIYAPGGSVINDRFWWKKQLEYMLPFWCAARYKIPMFVAAPSLGPFESKNWWRNAVRRCAFRQAEKICVRDHLSKQYLASIGVKKNICVTIDSAFYEGDERKAIEGVEINTELKEFCSKYPRQVGMTLTDFSWHVKYRNDEELSGKIFDTFTSFIENLKQRGIGVILIPQLFGNQNDREYLLRYKMDNVFVLGDREDSDFQQNLISKLYALIGMRYHSNIFAAKMGTPFIPVIYEEKMEGFIEAADLTEYAVYLKELSYQSVCLKFNKLENEYNAYKTTLDQKNEEWKAQAGKTVKLLAEFLGEKEDDEKKSELYGI